MTLAEILAYNQLPRTTYDAWARRRHIPFMKLRVREGVASKFDLGHAVALGAMKRFVDMGVDPKRAGAVIGELFPYIFENADGQRRASLDAPNWLTYVDHGAHGYSFAGGGDPMLDALAEVRGVELRYRVDMNHIIRSMNDMRGVDSAKFE